MWRSGWRPGDGETGTPGRRWSRCGKTCGLLDRPKTGLGWAGLGGTGRGVYNWIARHDRWVAPDFPLSQFEERQREGGRDRGVVVMMMRLSLFFCLLSLP